MKRLFLSIICLLTVGCNNSGSAVINKYDYDDVTSKILWSDIFIQEEEYYMVYFYRVTCAHCNELKEDILNYYFINKKRMYFVEVDDTAKYGSVGDLTLITCVEDFYIFGTPFLIEMENHKIKNYYAGVTSIRGFIAS